MFRKNKLFYYNALALALPSIIQQFVMIFSSMIDNIMVGSLDAVSIAGVSIANQIFWIYTIVLLGVCAVGGIFIAQYQGAGNDQKTTEVFRVTLLVASMLGIVFFLMMHFIPTIPLTLFSNDSETIDAALHFIKYIKYTFLLYSVSTAIGASLKYYGMIKISMYTSILAVIVNIILNYLLIKGNLGFPALGVEGSAIATLVARITELIVIIWFMIKLSTPIKTKVLDIMHFDHKVLVDYKQKAYGLITNEFFWALGFQLINVAYTQRTRDNIAALSISNVIINLITVGMSGMNVAVSILVGNSLGKGDFVKAKKDASRLFKLSAAIGIFLGSAALASSFFVTSLYNVDVEIILKARWMIAVAAGFAFLYYLNATHFYVLRAGGDTKSVLLMDSGFTWVIILPLAFLTGFAHLYMPVHYFIIQFLDLVKLIVARHRFKRGKWLVNLTEEYDINKAIE
ncbi:MATE family efflux transporter [Mycoplasma sp. P36-A1]|uniref:MATE family efflux transporter n=1 Tax=Mycoplasma sp. P36-A1 TaxID=3252900 RepID=UPI003C2B3E8A